MVDKCIDIKSAKALILGITFKEDCPDIRNTKVVGIYNELKQFGINVDIMDPIASREDVKKHYNISLIKEYDYTNKYDVLIIAVPHECFYKKEYLKLLNKEKNVIFDIKGVLPIHESDGRL